MSKPFRAIVYDSCSKNIIEGNNFSETTLFALESSRFVALLLDCFLQ